MWQTGSGRAQLQLLLMTLLLEAMLACAGTAPGRFDVSHHGGEVGTRYVQWSYAADLGGGCRLRRLGQSQSQRLKATKRAPARPTMSPVEKAKPHCLPNPG